MAGRGARIHHLPPSQFGNVEAWEEIGELLRLRKLFPDAKERQQADEFRRQLIARNKRWLSTSPSDLSTAIREDGAYKGQLFEGRPHGYGILNDHHGTVWEGEWLHAERHGWFRVSYSTGERFEGHFAHGRRHGEGTWTSSDGSKFHGDYDNDMRHGKGLCWSPRELFVQQKLWLRTYERGRMLDETEIYTEEQRACRPPAQGSFYGTWIDEMGRRYEGDFEEGKPHGKGRLTHPMGVVELGEWLHGARDGVGMRREPAATAEAPCRFVFERWRHGELLVESESDSANWDNFFWYDEGGFMSHN